MNAMYCLLAATFQTTPKCNVHAHCNKTEELEHCKTEEVKSEYCNGVVDKQGEDSRDSVDAQSESPDIQEYKTEMDDQADNMTAVSVFHSLLTMPPIVATTRMLICT